MTPKIAKGHIFLSPMELALSLKELKKKFGISHATAWRAKQRGWFFENYHDCQTAAQEQRKLREAKKFSPGQPSASQLVVKPLPRRTPAPQELPWRQVVELTDEQRQLTTEQVAQLFAIPLRTALYGRQRGWFCRISQLDWRLPDGALPEQISVEEVLRSALFGALAVCRGMIGSYRSRGDFDDIQQEAVLRLLRYTAHPGFASFSWRYVVAKNAARDYIRKLRTRSGFEVIAANAVDDDNEPSLLELAEQKLASRDPRPKANSLFGENQSFLAQIQLMVGQDNWLKLTHWAEHGTRNQPGEISLIISYIRTELGLS